MAYSMSDLKKGLKIQIADTPYKIIEYQHVKPGKGAAFVRTKIKSFLNGKVIEKTFHAGDKFEAPNLEDKKMQFSYKDDDFFHFMDAKTYDMLPLSVEQVGDAGKWIIDGMDVNILFFNSKAISVDVADVIVLEVVDTPPNFKGDTSSSSKKPATLESGAVVNVPFHVLEGDKIKIDTKNGDYLEKAK
jgi:elongation factor P